MVLQKSRLVRWTWEGVLRNVPDCLKNLLDDLRNVSDGTRKVSDGLRKVSDCLGKKLLWSYMALPECVTLAIQWKN